MAPLLDPRFRAFMDATLKPGVVRVNTGKRWNRVDVRRLDKLQPHVLQWVDNQENDYVAELELIPLKSDDAKRMLQRAAGVLAVRSRGTR